MKIYKDFEQLEATKGKISNNWFFNFFHELKEVEF